MVMCDEHKGDVTRYARMNVDLNKYFILYLSFKIGKLFGNNVKEMMFR